MSRHIKPRAEFFKWRSFVRTCHHAPTARLGILVTALIVLVAGYGASRTSEFQWFLLRASLHNQFPQVQWITTRELADWLEDRHRLPPVLLDIRTVEEWNVSHLPGARRVDPGASAEMALPGATRDVPVVTYCAAGHRSTEFTTRLRRASIPTANLGDSS